MLRKLFARSYLARLLLFAIALVVLLQASTYFSARAAIRGTLLDSARHELEVGADVFSQLLEERAHQLTSSVSVLVDDFGFKEAVATGETATVLSALKNHSSRVGADRAMVIDSTGRMLADTVAERDSSFPFPDLLQQADRNGAASANVVLDGVPYQFVVATIRAPARIGWAAMGFQLDKNLAKTLKGLTKLEISFVAQAPGQSRYLASTLESNLHDELKLSLEPTSAKAGTVTQLQLGGETMLTLVAPLSSQGFSLAAVLQTPLANVMMPYTLLSQQLLWIALAGFALAVAMAVLVGRNLTRSVRSLASASQSVAAGDYSTPVLIESEDELGELARAFVKMQTAIGERETQILYQSQHDHLTGLANRSRALQMLAKAIETARAGEHGAAVLVLDVNRFKAVNDSFGHAVGDQVLQAIAQRLQQSVKHLDTCVRLDGDEFLVVLEHADGAQAEIVAKRLFAVLAEPIPLPDLQMSIDASFGIAVFPQDGDDAEILMRRAAIAMFSTKHSAQSVACYQSGWDERNLRRLSLLQDLKKALTSEGLHLAFQPKLSLSDDAYLGAEVLLRWRHPQLGPLSPDEFIPLAESSGNISLITMWVLERAILQLSEWQQVGFSVRLSVNISALDLLERGFINHVERLLLQHGVLAQQLCLELTESSLMQEAQQSLATLRQLQELGIRLSVDDFGTGYSSLSQLRKMPVDEIKIDKSFVLNLADSAEDRIIVRSTIELGHNMGLQVVAEGVENEQSREILRGFGCDMVQGYLLSKPIPAADFAVWAKQHFANLKRGPVNAISIR
ncbi:MAG: diguanylate cyclase/phosphodiesterase [Verrucomicrobiaceae bacterium]|nr:diguanylate cyclase/phosphodiesterase [Verrucomicrobiaceae bacterium]